MFVDRKIWILLVVFSLVLSSCKPKTEIPQVDPQAVFTSAAETANAMMTQLAAVTPTQAPTDTPTVTVLPSPTTALTPTATLTLTSVPLAGNLVDRAEFVADVTVPDGTNFAGSKPFVKTWRLKNTGTSSWTQAYSLVFLSGNQMGGAASIPLQSEVAPGQTMDLSINLVAPAIIGQYTGYWILRNPLGKNFGVGINADLPIYLLINVISAGIPPASASPTTAAATPTLAATTPVPVASPTSSGGTPAPTTTPPPVGSYLSEAGISIVGNSNATAVKCSQHFFTFMITFRLNQDAPVSFGIEATPDNPAVTLTIDPPKTENLKAGKYIRGFQLSANNAFTANVILHITSPDDVKSAPVTVTLTCAP